MPHSTASESRSSEDRAVGDGILPDAPEQIPDSVKEEGKMDMIDDASHSRMMTGEVPRTDVKLEDLLNDVDGDESDELLSLVVSSTNNESSNSPPEAPL